MQECSASLRVFVRKCRFLAVGGRGGFGLVCTVGHLHIETMSSTETFLCNHLIEDVVLNLLVVANFGRKVCHVHGF
jgi:hypothetical protein